MRKLLPLLSLLLSAIMTAQTPADWHKIILPAGAPTQIVKMCDGWICRTNTGFYRSTDDGQSWTAIETQNLPFNGLNLQWTSNKKGLILTQTTITSQDALCKYWTDTFWAYNCTTHLFEQKFSSNSHDCFHSGGYGGFVSSFNDDSDWFYQLGYYWQQYGSIPPCEQAYRSTDGGQTWSSTACKYNLTQHTDSIFYLRSDSLWLDPPGPAVGTAIHALPSALAGTGAWSVAAWGGTIAVLQYPAQIFFTTDLGATWEEDSLNIIPNPYSVTYALFAAAGHFFFKTDLDSYVAPYTAPGAMHPLHPEGVPASGLLSVNSDKWWIRTGQNRCLRSDDYGQSWQEVSVTGLGPAPNAALVFDGQAPWATLDGHYYQLQADESLTKIDSAFAVPAYPRLSWERDTQKWVLLKNSLLRSKGAGAWDTLFEPGNGESYERAYQQDGRLYASRYYPGTYQTALLFSDSMGSNWTQTTIPAVRDFTVFQHKWFKISYATNSPSKIYSSGDLGATWQLEQPGDWTTADVFQVFQDQLYVTVYVPALQGRRIARWNKFTATWEIIGNTTGGGNCNASVANDGCYLLQNTNSNITFGTCYGDVETPLQVPFSYSYLYSYNPLLFGTAPGAQKYVLWGRKILARPESGGLWIADIRDLLHYEHLIDTAVCAGQSISIGDSLVQVAGTYPLEAVQSTLGLDSLTLLQLSVYPASGSNMDTVLAAGSLFLGQTISQDTVFTQLLSNVHGCDSLLSIQIHVLTSSLQDRLPEVSRVGPNPFTHQLSLWLEEPVAAARLQLLDGLGRVVWTANSALEKGWNAFVIADNLPAGRYILLVSTGHRQASWPLVRSREK